jgi:hypothetical protein
MNTTPLVSSNAAAGQGAGASTHAIKPRPGPPLWLLAELTYRCPLHCGFVRFTGPVRARYCHSICFYQF